MELSEITREMRKSMQTIGIEWKNASISSILSFLLLQASLQWSFSSAGRERELDLFWDECWCDMFSLSPGGGKPLFFSTTGVCRSSSAFGGSGSTPPYVSMTSLRRCRGCLIGGCRSRVCLIDTERRHRFRMGSNGTLHGTTLCIDPL